MPGVGRLCRSPVPLCCLRRSLAVVEMIAQKDKFCKPLLSDFVKARQSSRLYAFLGCEKTVQGRQKTGELVFQMGEMVWNDLGE